jgi:hypothetical protein
VDVSRIREEAEGFAEVTKGIIQSTLCAQYPTEIVVSGGEPGAEPDRFAILSERVVELAPRGEQEPEIVVSAR